MLKTLQGVKLQEWFGDFGGRFCVNDTALLRYGKPELEYEKVLPGNEYEEIFREVLKKTLPSYPTACVYQMYSERKLITLPEYGKYYNLAGHIALALAMEKKDAAFFIYFCKHENAY